MLTAVARFIPDVVKDVKGGEQDILWLLTLESDGCQASRCSKFTGSRSCEYLVVWAFGLSLLVHCYYPLKPRPLAVDQKRFDRSVV